MSEKKFAEWFPPLEEKDIEEYGIWRDQHKEEMRKVLKAVEDLEVGKSLELKVSTLDTALVASRIIGSRFPDKKGHVTIQVQSD